MAGLMLCPDCHAVMEAVQRHTPVEAMAVLGEPWRLLVYLNLKCNATVRLFQLGAK